MTLSTLARLGSASALLFLLQAATGSEALALEDEWTLGGGLTACSIPTQENGVVGAGIALFARYGLNDDLALALGWLASYHPASPGAADDPADDVAATAVFVPRLGLVYALDILELVPYVELDATAYAAGPAFFGDGSTWGVGAALAVGLDYRPWRALSFGVELGYHAFLTDLSRYPVFAHLALTAAWHSDPFDF